MSLKADRKQIRAELLRLDTVEIRVRRQMASMAAARELQQRELDTIVADRKHWQEVLAKLVQRELKRKANP